MLIGPFFLKKYQIRNFKKLRASNFILITKDIVLFPSFEYLHKNRKNNLKGK